jgi:hypothetical protein
MMVSSKKVPEDVEFQQDRMIALIALAVDESAAGLQEVSGQSMEVGPCPAQEELAAFSDGRLHNERRATIIAHMDRCEKCYREMLEVSSVLESLQLENTGGDPSKPQ